MASYSAKRKSDSSRKQVRFFYVVASAAILVFVFAFQTVRAQWFEPPFSPSSNAGGLDTDAPLYGSSGAAYGGNAQARTGRLTIGSASPFADSTLYVEGTTLIRNALKEGAGGFLDNAMVMASGNTQAGVYGVSANASGAGVMGETIAGGRGVIGDAGNLANAVGVYGFADTNGSKAIAGSNATGYAGLFEGRVKISNLFPGGSSSGRDGYLSVTGDSTLRSNLTVANLLDIGSLTIKGSPFEANKINAFSVQDQRSAMPANDPGISVFTLSSADPNTFCTNCTPLNNGIVAAGTALTWNVGPSSAKPLLDDTKMVVGYTVQYLDEIGGQYSTLLDFTSPTIEYQECNSSTIAGIFRLTNDTGGNGIFRVLVMYKDNPAKVVCVSNSKTLRIQENSGTALSNYTVSYTFDHAALVTAGLSVASGDDLRIFDNTSTEIDRILAPGSSWNSTTTTIQFRVSSLPANGTVDYTMQYPFPGTPPANRSNVYLFYDDLNDLNNWNQNVVGTITGSIVGGRYRATNTSVFSGPPSSWCGSGGGAERCNQHQLKDSVLNIGTVIGNRGFRLRFTTKQDETVCGNNCLFGWAVGMSTAANDMVIYAGMGDWWAANKGVVKWCVSGNTRWDSGPTTNDLTEYTWEIIHYPDGRTDARYNGTACFPGPPVLQVNLAHLSIAGGRLPPSYPFVDYAETDYIQLQHFVSPEPTITTL